MNKKIGMILLLLLTMITGCLDESTSSGQNDFRQQQALEDESKNIMIIKQYVKEILNKGNLAAADVIIGDDFVDPAAKPGEKGPESLKKVIFSFRKIFPDLSVTIDDMVVGKESIAWKWTAKGTNQGAIFGIAPTNKNVTFSGIIIDKIKDGKIIQRHGIWDRMGLKTQLLRK